MLLPKLWAIEGVALRVAEAEFVATDPAYRNRELQRRLFALFEQDAKAEGYTLSAVMGITSFYDRFGSSFALPAGYSLTMTAAEVARAVEDDPFRDKERRLSVRPATAADTPAVLALWRERDEGLQFREVKDLDHCRHYLGDLAGIDIIRGKWYLVEETPAPAGRVAAGFGFHPAGRHAPDDDPPLSRPHGHPGGHPLAAEETLHQQGQRLWLALRPGSSEHASAAGLGARPERPFGWQMRIIDRAGFLTALRPALERRLAASAFRGLEADLTLDLYCSQLVLRWRGGRLAEVTENPGCRPPPRCGRGCPRTPS